MFKFKARRISAAALRRVAQERARRETAEKMQRLEKLVRHTERVRVYNEILLQRVSLSALHYQPRENHALTS